MYTLFPAHYLENYLFIVFILRILNGLDRGMTHIDIGVIRSKVKVRRNTFVKYWFSLIIMRTVYHRGFIFHMRIGLGKGLTSINFVFFRSRSRSPRSLLKINACRSFC